MVYKSILETIQRYPHHYIDAYITKDYMDTNTEVEIKA